MDVSVFIIQFKLKELLENIYGKCRRSLVIDKDDDNSGYMYFYDYEIYNDMINMVNVLRKGYAEIGIDKFREITHDVYNKCKDKKACPQCACFYSLEDGKWYIEFRKIMKIRYHRTRGKKITATLVLDKNFTVKLTSEEKEWMYSYFGRPHYVCAKHVQETDGINYFINKNMFYNPQFREFSSKFFELIGNIENKYILKDVGRSIKNCGFFLVPVNYSELIQCYKPSDLINSYLNENDNVKLNFNKYDLNLSYIILKLKNYIDNKSIKLLCDIHLEKLKMLINLAALYDGFASESSVAYFIKAYYYDYYKNGGHKWLINDFVNLSIEMHEKISLNLSVQQMLKKHDLLAISQRSGKFSGNNNIELVKEDSKFNDLEKEMLDIKIGTFKRIHSLLDLYNEGNNQHNCVFPRKDRIKNDDISIFHWDYNDKSYTVQFSYESFHRAYILDEIRARFNEECSDENLKLLSDILWGVNVKIKNKQNQMID